MCYAKGDGTEQNQDKALEWFRKSVEQGYERAQQYLDSLPDTPVQ